MVASLRRGLPWLVSLLVLIPASFLAAAPDPAEVAKLIDQLGDDNLEKRQDAARKLETMGEDVLDALRTASMKHGDVDVRLRTRVIVSAIEKKLFGELKKYDAHVNWAMRVIVTPDGKQAISTGFDNIRVWDLETGKKVRELGGRQGFWGLSISKDGKRIASSGHDSAVRVWEMESGKLLQTFQGAHTAEVWLAHLTPDGKQVVSGGFQDMKMFLWDVDAGKQVRAFEGLKDYPRAAKMLPDGKHILVGHHTADQKTGTLRLWSLETGKEVRAYAGHGGMITCIDVSGDGKQVASSSFDGTIRIWEFESGKELQKLTGHPKTVDQVLFLPDGKRVVSVGWDGDPTVRVWDLGTGKETHRLDGGTHTPITIVLMPDGKRALTSGKDGSLKLWQLPK